MLVASATRQARYQLSYFALVGLLQRAPNAKHLRRKGRGGGGGCRRCLFFHSIGRLGLVDNGTFSDGQAGANSVGRMILASVWCGIFHRYRISASNPMSCPGPEAAAAVDAPCCVCVCVCVFIWGLWKIVGPPVVGACAKEVSGLTSLSSFVVYLFAISNVFPRRGSFTTPRLLLVMVLLLLV